MTNDGWGKLPTNNDGWSVPGKDWPQMVGRGQREPVPATNVMIQSQNAGEFIVKVDAAMAKDGWIRTASDEWSKTMPAGSTLTREDLPKWPVIQAVDWGATPSFVWPVADNGGIDRDNETLGEVLSADAVRPIAELYPSEQHRATEANWTHDALEGASNRAAVINSLRGVKDQYTIDQDGELSNIKETIAKPSDKETGVYIAYSNGKWLHAILSGPYDTQFEAMKWADAAYELFTEDGAFKLAFENNFDRDGIYYAEIPLSAKRHGAYGVLS